MFPDNYSLAVGQPAQRYEAMFATALAEVRQAQPASQSTDTPMLGYALAQLHGVRIAAHLAPHLEVPHVQIRGDPWPERAERVEALGPGPLRVAALQVPRGDVVAAGVAEDRPFGAGPVHPARAGRADHDRQFGLVLDLSGLWRQPDGVVRSDHRRGGLDEDERFLGDLVAEFGRVVGVVAAHADHLAREDRGEQPNVRECPPLARQAHGLERQTADLGHSEAGRAGGRFAPKRASATCSIVISFTASSPMPRASETRPRILRMTSNEIPYPN